jgi:phosphatidylglycerol lysyltransferase
MSSDADRERVLTLLEQHGWNATSFQVLEPGFRYWFDGDSACVGYVDTGSAWVAAGPPIAPADQLAAVAERFVAAARAAGRRASMFATEPRFNDAAAWQTLRIGEQPIWDPREWDGILKSSKSLREQLRRSRAKGLQVRQLQAAELAPGHAVRDELDRLITRWQASRTMAPMGFLVQVDPFTFPERRRYFVAEREGRVLGFLGVIPIYARRGWFFEDFLRDPEAPNGTIELLVDAGMRAAAAESIELVTLGLAPLAGEVNPVLRSARKLGRTLYDFEGLRTFKAKLKPRQWDPIFLAYPPRTSSLAVVFDTLSAFSHGGLLRFGITTLLRGPAIVFRLLATLLVAWTILLALPTSARFFPAPAWQWAWVGFDAVLFVALFALARRWRQPLADIVATAVTCDAIVTLGQVVWFDLPRRHGWFELGVIAMAVAAPTVAAVLLWHARVHRS